MPSQKSSPKEHNTNCLDGMECPRCGSLGSFAISCTSEFDVSDDGTGDHDSVEWEDDSPCTCGCCGFNATVHGFKIENLVPLSSTDVDHEGRVWIYQFVKMDKAREIDAIVKDESCPSCGHLSLVEWCNDGDEYESCLNGCCPGLSRHISKQFSGRS